MNLAKRGFTLIELLIVIGILAILATTVVLVLNPGELLKQARDTQRISDFKSMKTAIDLYLVRATTPTLNLGFCQTGASGVSHPWRASNWIADPIQLLPQGQPFTNPNPAVASAPIPTSEVKNIDGKGWISVPLSTTTQYMMSGNSPLSTFPVDPNPNLGDLFYQTGRYYAFQCQGLYYELNANMESDKYGGSTSDKNVEKTDGGTSARFGAGVGQFNQTTADLIYEVGNKPGLNL